VLDLLKSAVIVMWTAEGKSALFLVLAVLAKQKTVIVVVLYTALVKDLVRSAVKADVDCQR
jgi:superfamily II DNA helicase RecQ